MSDARPVAVSKYLRKEKLQTVIKGSDEIIESNYIGSNLKDHLVPTPPAMGKGTLC